MSVNLFLNVNGQQLINEPIYIIDDASTYEIDDNIELINTTIINSEYPGRGELLPYHYLLKLKLGKKAIMLQDSVFIKQKINIDNINSYKFLFDFCSREYINRDIENILEKRVTTKTDNSRGLWDE